MTADTPDTTAAVEHVRRLGEVDVHLTATELKLGFVFQGKRRILERGVSFWFPKVRRDACLYIRLALRIAYLGVHQAMLGPLGTAFIRIRNTQHLPLCPNLACCVCDHARYLRTPKPTVGGLTQVRHFASTMFRHAMIPALGHPVVRHPTGHLQLWCGVRRPLDP